ncbi:hypothetical protein L9F63_012976, partial [Diploptera punctata]
STLDVHTKTSARRKHGLTRLQEYILLDVHTKTSGNMGLQDYKNIYCITILEQDKSRGFNKNWFTAVGSTYIRKQVLD